MWNVQFFIWKFFKSLLLVGITVSYGVVISKYVPWYVSSGKMYLCITTVMNHHTPYPKFPYCHDNNVILITCQNLHFGKYVRLSVCYLPKFTIFGKYVRLSVCYLPKFTIFGKYVRLSVCLSVCLSVSLSVLSSITHERFDISSPNLVYIWNGWAVPVCDIDK